MQVGLFSGGKDSLTACHVMQDVLDAVVYCKTGIGLQENIDYVENTCKEFGWKLIMLEPQPHETYEIFVKRFGFPRKAIHSAVMYFLKWHALRIFARENNGVIFISGRRKKESRRRGQIMKKPFETAEKNMTFLSPLFYWSDCDVWDYIKSQELKVSPVYETLHMGGDCMCGAFSELGESELLSTFYPYMAKKIRELEIKYGYLHPGFGQWGNQSSMEGAMCQLKMDEFQFDEELACSECIIRNG